MSIRSEVHVFETGFPFKTYHTGDEWMPSMDFMHRHDCCEIALLKNGRGAYRLINRTMEINEGDMVVFGPRVPHQCLTSLGTVIKQPVVHFAESLVEMGSRLSLPKECVGAFVSGGVSLAYRIDASEPMARRLTERFDRLVYEIDGRQPGYKAVSLTIMTEMSGLLVRRLSEDGRLGDAVRHLSSRLSAAIAYIDKNYMRPLRLTDVAAVVDFNPSYFSSQFHKAYGVSFSDYLTGLRVEKAIGMLSNTDEKISTIADECGFGSLAIFYHHFSRYAGGTPRCIRADRNTASQPVLICEMDDTPCKGRR